MTAYVMQNGSLKSIPLSAVKPETLAQWWGWAGMEAETVNLTDVYKNVPWLYRGVNAICNSLVAMPHALHKGDESGEEIEDSLLNLETPLDDLLDIFTGHYLFYGACYGIIESNKYGIVKNFRPYAPKTIVPQFDADQGFTGVKRTVNGKEYFITVEQGLFYSWIPNREGETGPGVPAVAAALAAAGVMRNIDIYADMYFKNGAVNPTLISVENGSTLPADVERLKAWYKRMLSGVKKAFGIEMVSGKITAQTIGYALKDLATTELTASKRQDISTALGLPQTLLFSDAANYATAAQDDLHFYDKTIKPMAMRLQQALNRQVYQPMGYFLQFHPERMPIYQELKAKEASGVVELYKARIVTLNETRERLDLPPIEGGDEMAALPAPASMPNAANAEAGNQSPDGEVTPIEPATVLPSEQKGVVIQGEATHVHEHAENPVAADLALWQEKALKRLKEGKLTKALDFTSAVIRPSMLAAIKGSLEDVTEVAEVKRVFSHAIEWAAYP